LIIIAIAKGIRNLPKSFKKLRDWVERIEKFKEGKLPGIVGKKKAFQEFLKKCDGKSIVSFFKSDIVNALMVIQHRQIELPN